MGIPGPQNARGKILFSIVKGKGNFREITVLNISDWHAQIPPGTPEAADFVIGADGLPTGTAVGPTFSIAGAAFLDTWFDVYRSQVRDGSLLVAGGDSFGGATPPIANAFGDKPVPPIMNMMGFDAEAVGNHQFDRGEAVPPERADPARRLRHPVGERRRRGRQHAAGVVAVGDVQVRRREDRHRRLHDRGHSGADLPGQPRTVPSRRRHHDGERRDRASRTAADGRDHRARPRGR